MKTVDINCCVENMMLRHMCYTFSIFSTVASTIHLQPVLSSVTGRHGGVIGVYKRRTFTETIEETFPGLLGNKPESQDEG